MHTHSLTNNSSFLRFFRFLQTYCLGTSTPLLYDSSEQGNSAPSKFTKRKLNLQSIYYLERRFLL
jgi:hypothetical protein